MPGQEPTGYDQGNNRANAPAGFVYGDRGNLTGNPAGQVMSYDGENRLLAVSGGTAGTLTAVYDGEGRRVKKVVNGETVYYAYDAAGQVVAEYSSAATELGTLYVTGDHLGSTRVVSGTGAVKVVGRYDYLPYGEAVAVSAGNARSGVGGYENPGPVEVRRKFTGQERDLASLDHFVARSYGPGAGRFLSPDAPFADQKAEDPQSWNLYAYARNRPLLFVDPSGRDATIVYSTQGLSDELAEWFEKNKTAVLDAVRAKFNAAGVKNVGFVDAATLTAAERKQLSSAQYQADDRVTGTPGVARLQLAGSSVSWAAGGAEVPSSGLGLTNGGRSAVFLERVIGKLANEVGTTACNAVCGVANVIAHELGHAYGFDDPGHNFMNEIGFAPTFPSEWGRPNVMKQGGNPFAGPLPFRSDTNTKPIEVLNRAKPFPVR